MESNFSTIISAIITLVVTLLTGIAIPYIRSKTTQSQREYLLTLIRVAVSAAEQIFRETGDGPDRKTYVVLWLQCRGITIDSDELDALIEAAVYALKTGL